MEKEAGWGYQHFDFVSRYPKSRPKFGLLLLSFAGCCRVLSGVLCCVVLYRLVPCGVV